MSTVIRFLPELSRWLTQALDQGQTPDALVATMVGEKMQPEVATAIVGAFIDARRHGHAPPLDSVIVESEIADRFGRIDPRSLHAANPVATGEKWVATKWMRQRRFVSAGN